MVCKEAETVSPTIEVGTGFEAFVSFDDAASTTCKPGVGSWDVGSWGVGLPTLLFEGWPGRSAEMLIHRASGGSVQFLRGHFSHAHDGRSLQRHEREPTASGRI
jgi:hypothetical protein